MATLIFDFDSTVISCESLEYILEPKLATEPGLMEQIKQITCEAMAGRMPFREALEARLKISAPSLQELDAFGQSARQHLTQGMDELLRKLKERGVEIWVVSGGLRESLLPLALDLGFPESQVQAVRPLWNADGSFQALRDDDGFATSKVLGAKDLAAQWSSPVIGVGDGMTDYALYEAGLVDDFVIYAEHVQRQSVMDTGAPLVHNVEQLWTYLESKLDNAPILPEGKD